MNRILLIGNSGTKSGGHDGQTIKVRLYRKMIISEGFECDFVDLEGFSRHPLSVLDKIKKRIPKCDRIVLLTSSRGCRILIPFINKHNKKTKKPFVLPLVGIGPLHRSIRDLNSDQKNDFFINKNYKLGSNDKRMSKLLSSLSFVLPETELLSSTYIDYFQLNNVAVLNNFRSKNNGTSNLETKNNPLKMAFLSRITEVKGVVDLIEVALRLKESGYNFELDFFGNISLNDENRRIFDNATKDKQINYLGIANNDGVCEILSRYDLFVFPTRYLGEGTPGVIAESLLAGTPILTSDFPQAKFLLSNGYDSIFFKMFDNIDLEKKLLYILDNKDKLADMRKNALKSGEEYTYDYERKNFLKYVCGVEEDK